ncbi:MAG: hypothetical protein ACLSHD_01725 [Anaerostipes hadrus]
MSKRKCVICSNWIEKGDETVPYKNRLAHVQCFNSMMKMAVKSNSERKAVKSKKAKKINPKSAVLGDCLTEEESKQKRSLISYIEELFGEKANAKTYTQIKNLMRDYPYFTYVGLEQSIRFFYEIKENPITNQGLGIVPYVYDQAQEYFKNLGEVQSHNASISNVNELYAHKKVRIAPPKIVEEESIERTGGGYDW